MNEWVKVIRLKIAALWRFRIRSLKKKLERRSSQTLNKYICHETRPYNHELFDFWQNLVWKYDILIPDASF